MKNLLWVVLAAIVLIGGYVLVTGKSPSEIIETDNATAVETPETLPDATDEAAQEGAEAPDAAAEDAVSPDEAVADETATEESPADEAADAADDAAAGDDAATEAESAEDEAATDAVDTVTGDDAADETAVEADEADDAAAADEAEANGPLSVQGFDMAAAAQMIDGSSLSETQKMALKATLQQAQDNPEMLKAAIEQTRAALGM